MGRFFCILLPSNVDNVQYLEGSWKRKIESFVLNYLNGQIH